MKKILILPFLQMPSGHHQVADAISAYLKELDDSVKVKKVDIFHYTSRFVEQITSKFYLKAIKIIPSVYSYFYRHNACRSQSYKADNRYFLYDRIFLNSMKKLIKQENPDFIICTHCLPSYLLNLLKKQEQLSIPVINAYTDYFINNVWGITQIDFHLVPSEAVKHFLELRGVSPKKIAVTGIPIHPLITKKTEKTYGKEAPLFHVLVSGGNLGVGPIEKMLDLTLFSGKIKYFVLCGKNQQLFKKIEQLQSPFLKSISYISSREEMNELYERMDIMLTKPGGITISECLHKGIPLCLLDPLPGPEERNQQYLLDEKLAIKINLDELEYSLLLFLENEKEREKIQQRIFVQVERLDNLSVVFKKFL
ncbi:MGDG synthase family glycosyltransferase [Bacillus sp. 03113]|uniref:MGDG synthase family glycosyltransferase n=1 Tax=Bacillus sp. 03113 TaxID=2578211 RepID=UPI001142534E|nr:glycosyltransferase [Bacillus sp. 03113]